LIEGTSYVREGPRSPDGFGDNSAIIKLLAEIKSLRLQLEKSITTNNALRLKLEEQLSRPIRELPQASRVSPSDVARRLDFDKDADKKKPGKVQF
jgi:regulator of replication initiation timing